jgi:hypothetical protein
VTDVNKVLHLLFCVLVVNVLILSHHDYCALQVYAGHAADYDLYSFILGEELMMDIYAFEFDVNKVGGFHTITDESGLQSTRESVHQILR